MSKQALTPQQIAALQAGAKLGSPVQAGTPDETKPPAGGEVTDGAGTTEEPKPGAVTETAETQAAAGAAPAAVDQTAVVALLKEQLATAQNEVIDLRVSVKSATDKVASLEAAQAGLVKIAADSLNNMRVALNMPSVKCDGLSTEVLLKDHAAASAQFTEAFKVGGVAATSAVEALKTTTPDTLSRARVQATRI